VEGFALQASIQASMEKMSADPEGLLTLPTIFDFYTEVQ
jgi:hypothetical protein